MAGPLGGKFKDRVKKTRDDAVDKAKTISDIDINVPKADQISGAISEVNGKVEELQGLADGKIAEATAFLEENMPELPAPLANIQDQAASLQGLINDPASMAGEYTSMIQNFGEETTNEILGKMGIDSEKMSNIASDLSAAGLTGGKGALEDKAKGLIGSQVEGLLDEATAGLDVTTALPNLELGADGLIKKLGIPTEFPSFGIEMPKIVKMLQNPISILAPVVDAMFETKDEGAVKKTANIAVRKNDESAKEAEKKFTDANLEIGNEFKEKMDKLPFPQIFYEDRFAFEAAIIVRDAKFFDARFAYHNERHSLGLEEEKLSKSKYSKEFLLGNERKRIRAKVSESDFGVISGLDGIEIV